MNLITDFFQLLNKLSADIYVRNQSLFRATDNFKLFMLHGDRKYFFIQLVIGVLIAPVTKPSLKNIRSNMLSYIPIFQELH